MLVRGERVGLDVLRDEHDSLYAEWMNDPAVKAGTQYHGLHDGSGESRERRRAQSVGRSPEALRFVVVDLADDEVIGSTSLFAIDWRNRNALFGIILGLRRGQGLGTEATRLTLRWAFEVMSLASVDLRVLSVNVAGRRAYERAGFCVVGTRRRSTLAGGTLVDEIVMDAVAP